MSQIVYFIFCGGMIEGIILGVIALLLSIGIIYFNL